MHSGVFASPKAVSVNLTITRKNANSQLCLHNDYYTIVSPAYLLKTNPSHRWINSLKHRQNPVIVENFFVAELDFCTINC